MIPLAQKIRPKSLDDYVGQEHLVGKNGIIRQLIQRDDLPSMILWGPPGVGKTTLAHIIALSTKAHFLNYSAVTTTLAQIREAVKEARNRHERTILFLDEIHRFNKAQQDSLLPHVEQGTLILIGATTENPSFEVIGPLLSRSRVFTIKPLSAKHLEKILSRGEKELKIKLEEEARRFLILSSGGDARMLLNTLEVAGSLYKNKKIIEKKDLARILQEKPLLYDKKGEEHYNTISAFIKSMRASNVDAALHYLSRMVLAGEDPLFIARRMVIFASEDIGLAQPTALVVANAVFRACEVIGYPECQINLAHGACYLSQAKKSRASHKAFSRAKADAKKHRNLAIPLRLRNAPTELMKELGYGENYDMYPNKDESLLPERLKNKKYLY